MFQNSIPRHNSQLFEYDDLYRLTSFQLTDQMLDPRVNRGLINFRYDRIGNILYKGSPEASPQDLWDLSGSNTVVNLGNFSYLGARKDRLGRHKGEPPGPHAVSATESGRSYTYDDNGNMQSMDGFVAHWDFLDRLVHLDKPGLDLDFSYDYKHTRVVKSVRRQKKQSRVLYINQYFEIREGEAPTKFVYAGATRIARIKGTLTPNRPRIQRIRLTKGWNLVSLVVSPQTSNAMSVFGLDLKASLGSIYRLKEGVFSLVGPEEIIETGVPYWVFSETSRLLSIVGQYDTSVELYTENELPLGPNFVTWPRLETIYVKNIFKKVDQVWAFKNAESRWKMQGFGLFDSIAELADPLSAETVMWADINVDGQLNPTATADQDILYYHGDHLGSSNLISDRSGSVVEENLFYPFGSVRYQVQATDWFDAAYKYTGKELDVESGLYYYEARYYVPAIARFATPDPLYVHAENQNVVENPQLLGLYTYVLNNPVHLVDPTGMEAVRYKLPEQERKLIKEEVHKAVYSRTDPNTYHIGLSDENQKRLSYLKVQFDIWNAAHVKAIATAHEALEKISLTTNRKDREKAIKEYEIAYEDLRFKAWQAQEAKKNLLNQVVEDITEKKISSLEEAEEKKIVEEEQKRHRYYEMIREDISDDGIDPFSYQ